MRTGLGRSCSSPPRWPPRSLPHRRAWRATAASPRMHTRDMTPRRPDPFMLIGAAPSRPRSALGSRHPMPALRRRTHPRLRESVHTAHTCAVAPPPDAHSPRPSLLAPALLLSAPLSAADGAARGPSTTCPFVPGRLGLRCMYVRRLSAHGLSQLLLSRSSPRTHYVGCPLCATGLRERERRRSHAVGSH